MKIVELTSNQFDTFAKKHPLSNYCQCSKYALIMSEYGYSYDYIGYVDDNNTVKAASLILTKKATGKVKYGYAPKGFLINYYDQKLLNDFITDLKNYYKEKEFIFIKFDPEIIIGETTKEKNYQISYNGNVRIIDELKALNIKRRVETDEFEFLQPKFNAYINLKQYKEENLPRNYRKKINSCSGKGLSLITGDAKQVDLLYKLIKNDTVRPISYYRNMFNVYNRDNAIDLVLVKVDYQEYITNIKAKHALELEINERWDRKIQEEPKTKNINQKMKSDKRLADLKQEILDATAGLKKHPTDIIAGALIIKHYNRVCIIASGFNREYKNLQPNYFLYNSIFNKYKDYYSFCDMNGVSGNFEKTSKYFGLNYFKTSWNPTIYEFIGEFDLVCSEKLFKALINTTFIEDEFNKKHY